MGILNVTPDSFSDGGRWDDPVSAGFALVGAGADIVDVGGESTRPGAGAVLPEVERERVLPVVRALAGAGICVSVDTRNASTMAAVLEAGASIINDVSALRHDPGAAGLLARHTCGVVLMHMRGTPQTMAGFARYGDVVAEVRDELAERVAFAESAGIARERLMIDPGLGFAKTAEQSAALLRGLPELAALGLPIVVGASRKRFIGEFGGEPEAARRGPGSIAAALFAASQGAAVLRVHDVADTSQALKVWQRLADCVKEGLLF
jgi:dihydropteroate synthase